MNTGLSSHPHLHFLGEFATHPIARRISRLAALIVLAGCSLRRPRALPVNLCVAHSGATNYRF
jgi:hypothetical protein